MLSCCRQKKVNRRIFCFTTPQPLIFTKSTFFTALPHRYGSSIRPYVSGTVGRAVRYPALKVLGVQGSKPPRGTIVPRSYLDYPSSTPLSGTVLLRYFSGAPSPRAHTPLTRRSRAARVRRGGEHGLLALAADDEVSK